MAVDPEALVPVQTFNGMMEAEIARGVLETYDIPSFINNEDVSGIGPALSLSVKLMVRAGDLIQAMELLEGADTEEDLEHRERNKDQGV
jgi:hypothetical protein